MLDYIMRGKNRAIWYKSKYRSVKSLSQMDECIISLPTLVQRISQGINNSERSGWDSVEKCLITRAIKGCPKQSKHIKRKDDYNIVADSYFLKVMLMMPVNNSKPRVIQSR